MSIKFFCLIVLLCSQVKAVITTAPKQMHGSLLESSGAHSQDPHGAQRRHSQVWDSKGFVYGGYPVEAKPPHWWVEALKECRQTGMKARIACLVGKMPR